MNSVEALTGKWRKVLRVGFSTAN